MDEALVARYWCHMCSQMVNPIMDEMKCPFCEDGFVEEVDSRRDPESDPSSDRALALWAPILLGMMGGHPSRRRRIQREEEEEQVQGESEQERDAGSIIRRRRRSSTAFLQLLQGIRAGITSESDGSESERDRERVILINPYNQAIILQGSFDMNNNQNTSSSLGDYLMGPGLDMLLQHLAENDPSRYGTPPTQKEAVDAMPTVKIGENLCCSVCLEDFDVGAEAKEMPCKHKFHGGCILPWLEMHSSCPVCRFQMPVDELPKDSNVSGNSGSVENSSENSGGERGGGEEGGGGNGRRFWAPIPWPFNGLFSFSGSQSGGNSSSSSSSSDTPGISSHTAEN